MNYYFDYGFAELIELIEFKTDLVKPKRVIAVVLLPWKKMRNQLSVLQLQASCTNWGYALQLPSKEQPSKMKHGVPRDVDEPEMVYLSIAGGHNMSNLTATVFQLSLQVQKLQQEKNNNTLLNSWHLRELVTTEEAEVILDIKDNTLNELCKKGKLGYIQHVGTRKRFFKVADIKAYFEAGYHPPK